MTRKQCESQPPKVANPTTPKADKVHVVRRKSPRQGTFRYHHKVAACCPKPAPAGSRSRGRPGDPLNVSAVKRTPLGPQSASGSLLSPVCQERPQKKRRYNIQPGNGAPVGTSEGTHGVSVPRMGPTLKAFVINLARRPDRREHAEELCRAL